MAMGRLRINQSNREFWSRYTITINMRELTLSFLYVTGTGMVIFIFLFLNHKKVTTGHLTQQQLTTRSQQTLRGNVFGAQMENKTLKGGNECDQGWESNQKYPKLSFDQS